jgi:hypothetical protein
MDAGKIRFQDDQGSIIGYSVYLIVNFRNASYPKILLGRDIIDQWSLRYNKAQNVLEADLISCASRYP